MLTDLAQVRRLRPAGKISGSKSIASTHMTEAYCSECCERREMVDAIEDVMKNGRRTIKGNCATCGEPVFKIVRPESASVREQATSQLASPMPN